MNDLRTIILVEDDPDIAILAQLALTEIGGFEVTHYGSGPALLEDSAAIVPDLYLLDYRLPDMTGEELLARLREDPQSAAVPAIFMTASLMPDRIKALKVAGAMDVIAKPFDPLTLADELRARFRNAQS
ncbi:CheY-like chemotaxis protein [Sphingomonas kaistensis]|uniref:CheY-like chemotaxis protein n=1 Tax=Sphingomonas kaistensis TaxID=298708 RepID=A0A7X5Y649_9SPHN|nr:response regulator [Sphingomonas kaistensis]NJC05794.1 CheY-like chemotaxis protein [Sphingomonas kaistensis]